MPIKPICIICGHRFNHGGIPVMLRGEGWIHAKCDKEAKEGKRWIKGLECDTEARTDVAADSGSGQLSSVPKLAR